jgi:Lon-like protease
MWGAIVALVSLVLSVVAAVFVPVPYIAVRPGTVWEVGTLVSVADVDAFPTEESVSFSTVRISPGRISLLEALGAWIDGDAEVLPEQVVGGGRTAEENQRFNAQLMDASKQSAITVALRHLGYDVHVVTSGSVVAATFEDSPADGVLRRGDVIVAVDGVPVDRPEDLGELLQEGGPGAEHRLSVEREPGQPPEDVVVSTIPSEDEPDRAIIGVAVQDRIVDFEFPFTVSIDSGAVGGPSAGLAFTLAVLDHLTPGSISGGARVAVTGTIDLEGRVGPVGGVPQKAVAVRDAGYDAFLVPAEEAEALNERFGDQLHVIGVGTLDDALEALDAFGGNALALGQPGRDQVAA